MDNKTKDYDPNTTLKDISDEWVCKAVNYCHGNLTKASNYLGISRATMYRKLDDIKKVKNDRK